MHNSGTNNACEMNIKEKIQELIFRQVRKRHPHGLRYQSYRSTKRVLILFESEMQEINVQTKALIKQLQQDGKEVTAWGFVPDKKAPVSAILRDYRVLAEQDYNRWGLPLEGTQRDLSREHFDLLIDLNMNNRLQLRYLNVLANADFRAGQLTDDQLCDFMIDVQGEDNPAYLFDQIIHYIKAVDTAE